MGKVTGLKLHLARLDNLTNSQAQKAITAGLFVAGNLIQTEAQLSITRGSVSGAGHKASAPGSAPSNDTGVLKNNIETVKIGPLAVEVQSKAPYALIHEFGGTIDHPGGTPYFIDDTGKAKFVSSRHWWAQRLPKTKPHKITMPERPYMKPAAKKMRPEVAATVRDVVNEVIRRKGG